jgi:5-methylthioadenosine/S-adenosylhomocysteine deaminase
VTTSVDLLVRGGTAVLHGGAVEADIAATDGRITAIGRPLDVAPLRTVDAAHCAVLPGFVNAHMHECLERGVFEDLPFARWLDEFALPKDRAYEPRHQRAAALLNQLEMIRNGTTSFIDIFRFPGEAAAVALQSGLRGVFSPQVIDDPAGAGESLESNLAFIEEWRNVCPDRLHTWFGPHAVYSCREETFERMAAHARAYGIGIHTHLAETRDEVRSVAERTGLTPAALLDRLVGPGVPLLVAHGIHLNDDDIALAATRGWSVAHCPTSNMKLGNGTAPVPRLLDAGVTVGLGTDSIMTNNNLDMFEEMRMAALVQKLVLEDATAMPCDVVLGMATRGSARALGLTDVGELAVGKWADLVVVDLERPHLLPLLPGTLTAQLVYSASGADVKTTVVAGRVLMEDRTVTTIDEGEVRDLVGAEATHLLTKAGVLHG